MEAETLEWVSWFNNRRLLEPIGYVPPAEFEEEYYRSQETQAKVAVTCPPRPFGSGVPLSCRTSVGRMMQHIVSAGVGKARLGVVGQLPSFLDGCQSSAVNRNHDDSSAS